MRLVIAIFLVFLSFNAVSADRGTMVCAKQVTLMLTEVSAPVEIVGEKKRKDRVELEVPVGCRSGRYIKPMNEMQAVKMLDSSLPLDLKYGLLGGTYPNPYLDANYGASAMDDLFVFFSDAWSLSPSSSLCRDISAKIDGEDAPPCFFVLVNRLRSGYREGADK